jgi:hypothetical protein
MRGLLLAQDIGASVMLMSASQEHFDRWAASRSKAATTSDPELTVPRHGSGDDDDNPAWDNVGIANSFAQPLGLASPLPLAMAGEYVRNVRRTIQEGEAPTEAEIEAAEAEAAAAAAASELPVAPLGGGPSYPQV